MASKAKKKAKAKANKQNAYKQPKADERRNRVMLDTVTALDELLEDELACNTCSDIGGFYKRPVKSDHALIEYYLDNLPGIQFVRNQLVNYIFADGLVAGGVEENNKLDKFLFSHNQQSMTNYAVLRDTISLASVYGESGLRWYKGDVYSVKPGTYAPAVIRQDGIEQIICYFATKDGSLIDSSEFRLDDIEEIVYPLTPENVRRYFYEKGYILLDKSEFVNVRNSTGSFYGESPLLKDRLRLDLLVTAYEILNHDLKYDGPGRLIVRPRTGILSDPEGDTSTAEVVNQSVAAIQQRGERAKRELARVAKEIKESTSSSIIALSSAFDEKIEKLPRVTKATEFFGWLEGEMEIEANVLGLPPSLLEAGDLSGNVSMTRIIDNAMLDTIVPEREKYATQFSPLLAPKLGLSKIYFGKYILQSEESKASARLKVATTIQQLGQLDPDKYPEVKALIGEFVKQLDYDIHDSIGGVVELSLGRIDEGEHRKDGKL